MYDDDENEGLYEERRRNEQGEYEAEVAAYREQMAARPKVMAFEADNRLGAQDLIEGYEDPGLVIVDQQDRKMAVLPKEMLDSEVERFCDERGWNCCGIIRKPKEVQP